MKHMSFVSATQTPAAGQLPTAMATPVLSARMMRLGCPLAHVIAMPSAEANPLMDLKTRHALDALAISATKASLFVHGRIGAFLPRTRGLAQHDV
jgi:hypothetical protein